jgi:hypothetical protein
MDCDKFDVLTQEKVCMGGKHFEISTTNSQAKKLTQVLEKLFMT